MTPCNVTNRIADTDPMAGPPDTLTSIRVSGLLPGWFLLRPLCDPSAIFQRHGVFTGLDECVSTGIRLTARHPFIFQRPQVAGCCLIGSNQALVALAMNMRCNGHRYCSDDRCPPCYRQLKGSDDSE